ATVTARIGHATLRIGSQYTAERAICAPKLGATFGEGCPSGVSGSGSVDPIRAGFVPYAVEGRSVTARRCRVEDRGAGTRLPVGVAPATNGEFVPRAASPYDRDLERTAIAVSDDCARRTGVDRRRFLQSAAGVAAVLATIDLAACSSSARRASSPPPSARAK